MPLFRDRIALETCPAKTAESVGYGVTFAVLGWLLLGNYAGLGYAGRGNPPLSSTVPAQSAVAAPATLDQVQSIPLVAATSALTDTSGESELPAIFQSRPESKDESSQFYISAPAWHTELESLEIIESYTHQRTLSAANWATQGDDDAALPTIGFHTEFNLPLPLIDPIELLNTAPPSQLAGSQLVAESSSVESDPIHEITVTGAESARLSTRADNIQRPQIPRPYRAQDLQRSFVLPPRIQALKP